MPSAHRRNSMPAGIRAATIMASWPAPLDMRCAGNPARSTARSSIAAIDDPSQPTPARGEAHMSSGARGASRSPRLHVNNRSVGGFADAVGRMPDIERHHWLAPAPHSPLRAPRESGRPSQPDLMWQAASPLHLDDPCRWRRRAHPSACSSESFRHARPCH